MNSKMNSKMFMKEQGLVIGLISTSVAIAIPLGVSVVIVYTFLGGLQ